MFIIKRTILILFIFPLVNNCDVQKKNVNPNIEIKDTKSYFVTNKYQNYSNLYSYDFVNNNLSLEISKSDSSDGIVFQKYNETNNYDGIYFSERFSKEKSSRITYYPSKLIGTGNERTDFPMNLYNIFILGEKLIGIGHDKGEIIVTDQYLINNFHKSFKISGLINENLHNPADSSANLNSILYANNKLFVVSIGSYATELKQPFIYQLSNDLKQADYPSWSINCFNAFQQIKVIDESKLVIVCNPFENSIFQNNLSIYLIDVSTVSINQKPSIIKILEKQRNENGLQQLNIGGISDDRKFIFINERKKLNNHDKFIYNEIVSSYWLDLSNPDEIQTNDTKRQIKVNTVAGNVTYNYAAKKYLFSCLIDISNKTCFKKMGAISNDKEAISPTKIDLNIKESDDLKFPIPIF